MRWLGRFVLLVLAIIAVILAIANDGSVELRLVPEGMPVPSLPTVTLPLFVVIYATLFCGIVLGVVFEWMRGVAANRRARRRAADPGAS